MSTVKKVIVTPAMAASWLETMTTNRPVRQARVAGMIRDRQSGNWRLTTDAIGFVGGRLVNGQHRMWMVVESGLATEFFVAEDLAEDVAGYLDRPIVRTVADDLVMSTGMTSRDAKSRAARARVLRSLTIPGLGPTTRATDSEMMRFMDSWEAELEWSFTALPSDGRLQGAPFAGAFCYARRADPEQTATSARLYSTGAGLTERDPILLIRDLALVGFEGVAGAFARLRVALKTLRGLDAHRKGESLARLYDSPAGLLAYARQAGDEKTIAMWTK